MYERPTIDNALRIIYNIRLMPMSLWSARPVLRAPSHASAGAEAGSSGMIGAGQWYIEILLDKTKRIIYIIRRVEQRTQEHDNAADNDTTAGY